MKYILVYFLIFISSFSLELSDKDFDMNVPKEQSIFKEYTLTNNSELEKEYFLNSTDKAIKVTPKGFRLKPFENKKFKIIATGNKELGKHDYYLEIKEVIKKEPQNNEININKLFRIKQKYEVVK